MRQWVVVGALIAACTWAAAGGPGAPIKPGGFGGAVKATRAGGAGVNAKPGATTRLAKALVTPGSTSQSRDPYGPVIPTTQPDLSKLPRTLQPWNGVDTEAVKILKRAYASTAWLGQVKSFHIDVRSTTFPPTAEQTAAKKKNEAALRKYGVRPSPPNASVYRWEFAFEDRRIYSLHEPVGSKLGSRTIRIWDGKMGCLYDLDLRRGNEGYGLEPKLDPIGSQYNGGWWPPPGWPGRFRYWFEPKDKPDYYNAMTKSFHPAFRLMYDDRRDQYPWAARPDDYHLVGKQVYRGVQCYVLEQRPAQLSPWRVYIGVETGLLHGQLVGTALLDPTYGHKDPREEEIYEAIGYPAKKREEIAKVSSSNPTEANLPARARAHQEEMLMEERFREELHRRGFETQAALWLTTGLPSSEHWWGDFKEVAPGCFWPMKCGMISYALDAQGRLVGTPTHLMEVQKVEVNTDVPDELFTIKIKEGVHVNDRRYDPPLSYNYRPGLPDEPMLAKWREERAKIDAMIRERKAALDSLIGKPAPELAVSEWYHGKPLTWKDLRGRTVILEFLGGLCAKGDEARLAGPLHEHRYRSGLYVIAVHGASEPKWHVSDRYPWDPDPFPIGQDSPGANPANGGATHERYQIATGPYAFVIGPDGKVVHHGLLPELPEVKAYCESLPPLHGHKEQGWTDDLPKASSQATAKPAR